MSAETDYCTFRPRSRRSAWRKSLALSYRAPPLASSRARGSTTLPTVSGPSRSAVSDHFCRRLSGMYSADRTTSKGILRLWFYGRDELSPRRMLIIHEKHHGKRLVWPLQCPRRIECSTKRPLKG